MRIRANDMVVVIRGRDRGKQGRVQRAFPKEGKVLVDGVNVVKRHMRARSGVQQAGIIEKELPIWVSNVMLICTQCNRPTRVGYTFLADGTKARVCKKCKEVIE